MSQNNYTQRTLCRIATDIREHWKPAIHRDALPYVIAMSSMGWIGDKYGVSRGDQIVAKFLSNAATWHGEDARRVKAELREMLDRDRAVRDENARQLAEIFE